MDNLTSKAPRSDKPTTMTGYSESIVECFDGIPDVARPLIGNAEQLLKKIEKMLYSAPAFIGTVRAAIPEEAYQVILTDEQKAKIADGALKLMTKKTVRLWLISLIRKQKRLFPQYHWVR